MGMLVKETGQSQGSFVCLCAIECRRYQVKTKCALEQISICLAE